MFSFKNEWVCLYSFSIKSALYIFQSTFFSQTDINAEQSCTDGIFPCRSMGTLSMNQVLYEARSVFSGISHLLVETGFSKIQKDRGYT